MRYCWLRRDYVSARLVLEALHEVAPLRITDRRAIEVGIHQ